MTYKREMPIALRNNDRPKIIPIQTAALLKMDSTSRSFL